MHLFALLTNSMRLRLALNREEAIKCSRVAEQQTDNEKAIQIHQRHTHSRAHTQADMINTRGEAIQSAVIAHMQSKCDKLNSLNK